jgi:hypothetical protein
MSLVSEFHLQSPINQFLLKLVVLVSDYSVLAKTTEPSSDNIRALIYKLDF